MDRQNNDIRAHSFAKGFVYAARGIAYAVKTQRNMRIHLCFAIAAIVLGFAMRIDDAGWLAVVICIGSVFSLEIINTALESICDGITLEKREFIRIAKDCAAGAVLVAAIASLVVAAIVFLPRIAQILGII